MKKLFDQIIKFGLIGALCFFIDFGLYSLLNYFGINYLISGAVGFISSLIVNYLLNMKYVFVRREDLSRINEIVIYLLLSLIGLSINEIILYICTPYVTNNLIFNINLSKHAKLISKIIATGIVTIFNFITRKIFLEGK